MTTTSFAPATKEQVGELAGRLFESTVGAAELFNVYLGTRLNLYRALEESEPLSAAELADRTGLAHRYIREWLQSQAISGFLQIDGDDVDRDRYSLAPGVHEALIDRTHPAYLGGLPGAVATIGRIAEDLAEAFRTGEGVSYQHYGPEAVSVQEALNRPAYENKLVSEWLPRIPDVLARLRDTTQLARVADFCTGSGWSSIVLAEAFDHITVDGFDNDPESITRARANAAERGVSSRTRFEVRDVAAPPDGEAYDAAFVFEAIHDLPHPVQALAAIRQALKPGTPLIVMDERVGERLSAPGGAVERFMAAVSAVWCTPQGHGPGSDVVGAVMRPHTMVDLARRAGFTTVDILPIEHMCWRFYRLEA